MFKVRQKTSVRLWIAFGTAVAYVLVVTAPYGPGITSDSIHYITAARDLLENGQLRTYTSAPMASYAPLLSWIYALWVAIGVDPQLGAIITSSFSLGATVWVVGLWLTEILPERTMWIAGMLAVLLCRPLLWYAPYALSEAPFMALVLGALWNVWRYVHTGRQRFLMWGILFSALSPLMRYIGVSVVVAGGIFLLWRLCKPLYKRAEIVTIYFIASIIPLVLWGLRNRAVSGTFSGVREPSDNSLGQMVFETLWSWHRWVFPVAFENSVSLFGMILLCLLVLLAVVLYRLRDSLREVRARALEELGIFIVVYGTILIATVSGIKFEGFSERLWLPISIPVVLMGVLVYYISDSERSLLSHVARTALLIMWVGWLVSGGMTALGSARQAMSHQLGVFSTAEWRHSDLVRYLRHHKPGGKVFCNFPEPLYYLTGIVSEQTPHKGPMRVASETFPRNLPQFLQVVRQSLERGERVYIVWFFDRRRSHYMCSLNDLEKRLELQQIERLGDGALLEVRAILPGPL